MQANVCSCGKSGRAADVTAKADFDPQRKWQLPLAVHKALGEQADGATRRNVLIARAPAILHLDVVNGKPIPAANTRHRGGCPVR